MKITKAKIQENLKQLEGEPLLYVFSKYKKYINSVK